jgi:hypothetical protein
VNANKPSVRDQDSQSYEHDLRLLFPYHEILGRPACSVSLLFSSPPLAPTLYPVLEPDGGQLFPMPDFGCMYANVLFCRRNEKEEALQKKRSHTLRYVLKNVATGRVLFVVLFTLYLKEDIDEHGNVKQGVEGGMPFDKMADSTRADRLKTKAGEGDHEGDHEADREGGERMVDVDDDGVD